VHDAISAEKLGIPAVGVMTHRFVPTARTMARFLGFADYPVASIEHPISNNTESENQRHADEILQQVVDLLVMTGGRRGLSQL
jgi:hypothetical protein